MRSGVPDLLHPGLSLVLPRSLTHEIRKLFSHLTFRQERSKFHAGPTSSAGFQAETWHWFHGTGREARLGGEDRSNRLDASVPLLSSCKDLGLWKQTTVAPLNGGDDSVASSISLSTEHLFENAYYHQNNKKISMFPLSSFLLCSLSFSFSLYFFSFFS